MCEFFCSVESKNKVELQKITFRKLLRFWNVMKHLRLNIFVTCQTLMKSWGPRVVICHLMKILLHKFYIEMTIVLHELSRTMSNEILYDEIELCTHFALFHIASMKQLICRADPVLYHPFYNRTLFINERNKPFEYEICGNSSSAKQHSTRQSLFRCMKESFFSPPQKNVTWKWLSINSNFLCTCIWNSGFKDQVLSVLDRKKPLFYFICNKSFVIDSSNRFVRKSTLQVWICGKSFIQNILKNISIQLIQSEIETMLKTLGGSMLFKFT